MTRFRRTRLGRAMGPSADLIQSLGGAPPPDVLHRASEGRGFEPPADAVFVEEVDERRPPTPGDAEA